MRKQMNCVDSPKQTRTTFLTGSVLRIREDAPLLPANVAAALMTLQLESNPVATREEIAAGFLRDSCSVIVRPIDIVNYRRKFGARIGISQRPSLRSRDVKIID